MRPTLHGIPHVQHAVTRLDVKYMCAPVHRRAHVPGVSILANLLAVPTSLDMTDTRNRYIRVEPEEAASARAEEQATLHHGGSFRKYMEHKNIKLREQFEVQALHTGQQSDLFKGVAIHVNGRTVPSHQVSQTAQHAQRS